MEKMTGKSMDLIAENIKQMKALFPEAVTEGKIDFEVLKALLGEEVEKRKTYYKFTWNGKEEARAYARVPSMGTLRPCVEESSGKDGTPGKFDSGNLYIEGDNLEVLKLLQGSYHKRVKMIYIDPPYNTGKDFVYPDDYRNPIGEYKALTGQTDSDGAAMRANPETSGRYHTDWLNMMYPRLILARNLLTDDGVIFISIDEKEVANLQKIADDVFGEENCISIVENTTGASQNGEGVIIQNNFEFCLVYARDSGKVLINKVDKADESLRSLSDAPSPLNTRPDMGYTLYFNPQTKNIIPFKDYNKDAISTNEESKVYSNNSKLIDMGYIPVRPGKKNGLLHRWRWGFETCQERISEIVMQENGGTYSPYFRQKGFNPPKNTWSYGVGTTQLKNFFGDTRVFDFSKSPAMIKYIVNIGADTTGIVLDFFSGSATTAHAVMQLNAEDGGNRKFIMVQLPEACEEGTEAFKSGYKNICEIGKERIRRAAKKIKDENPLFAGDMGFKVFKLDTSNIRPWNPDPDKIELSMYDSVENILKGRSREDLLYEVLLKCNLPLTRPIEEKKFGENTVYIVGSGMLAICLDKTIPQTIAEEIVKLRDEYAPSVPMQVVFRDNGFTDVAKTNVLQILQQAGFEDKSVQTI